MKLQSASKINLEIYVLTQIKKYVILPYKMILDTGDKTC